MFLCYTHLKEDKTAKSYSSHTVGQSFWAISNIPMPKLAVSSKHLPTARSTRQREWEGKGVIRYVCVCVCVCARARASAHARALACIRVCVCVCVCVCVRDTLVDRYEKSDNH